jgi:hypothetical protein
MIECSGDFTRFTHDGPCSSWLNQGCKSIVLGSKEIICTAQLLRDNNHRVSRLIKGELSLLHESGNMYVDPCSTPKSEPTLNITALYFNLSVRADYP